MRDSKKTNKERERERDRAQRERGERDDKRTMSSIAETARASAKNKGPHNVQFRFSGSGPMLAASSGV